MDIWNTILGFLPFIIDLVSPVATVVGGAAVIASTFAKPESQWGRKIHTLINLLGANFGKASNKDD